jgi:hypothetical protein
VKRGIAAFLTVAALLGGAGAAALAATGGNAKAIAFYARSQTAMAAFQGIHFKGGGTSYTVVPTSGGTDNFRFDFGSTPAGYSRAVDQVQVVQRGGQVVEEVDTLTAPGLPTLKIWQQKSIEVGEVVNGAKTCAELIPKNSASFVTIGRPFVVFASYTFGKLTTPKKGLRLVRTSYPLAGGIAHERDTISAATRLWRSSHLVVTGGPYDKNFLNESHFSYSRTHAMVRAPRLGRCP